MIQRQLDNIFHDSNEIEQELYIPLLTSIPYIKKYNYKRSLYKLFKAVKPLNSLVITSSSPSEGKSLVNLLFARLIAGLGKRVLLIDADMRRPQLHHNLDLHNNLGLSHLLVDETLDWRDVTQDLREIEGFHVIAAGSKPETSLNSHRLQSVLGKITDSEEFDIVLIDTPPVMLFEDSALIGKCCDGLVLVVSINKVYRNLPAKSLKKLKENGVIPVGMVTNLVNLHRP